MWDPYFSNYNLILDSQMNTHINFWVQRNAIVNYWIN